MPAPCRFFQIGTCRAGSSCRFTHDRTARAVSQEPCKFFAAGYCAHGEHCAFRHGARDASARLHPAAPPSSATPLSSPASSASDTPLSFLARPSSATPAPPASPPSPSTTLSPAMALSPATTLAASATSLSAAEAPSASATARAPASEALSARASSSPSAAAAAPASAHAPRKPLVLSQQSGFSAAVRGEPAEDAATWITPTDEELRASRGECCAICLEPVVQRNSCFGLLDGCSHAFCLACIRQWRETYAKRPDVARSCPVCRTPSHFVIPSSFVVSDSRKRDLIRGYQKRLRAIPCRHFAFGDGQCPFGNSCFYAHTDRMGHQIHQQPRQAYGAQGSKSLVTYKLSEFLFPNEDAVRLEAIPLAEE